MARGLDVRLDSFRWACQRMTFCTGPVSFRKGSGEGTAREGGDLSPCTFPEADQVDPGLGSAAD